MNHKTKFIFLNIVFKNKIIKFEPKHKIRIKMQSDCPSKFNVHWKRKQEAEVEKRSSISHFAMQNIHNKQEPGDAR